MRMKLREISKYNMTAPNNFRKHFQKIFLLGKDELSFVTKCLFPCNFIEYKESISFQFQLVSTSTISDTRWSLHVQTTALSKQDNIMANIYIEHNSSFQGGGGLLQHLPTSGHWRHSRHVHWTQLSHGLGWNSVVLAKISSQKNIEIIKYHKSS